jgi:hypothetical protein
VLPESARSPWAADDALAERLLAAARSGLRRPVRELHSAFPEPRSESHCPRAVRSAVRAAHPSRGPLVVAEFESGEQRRAVRPVPKATASRPPVVAVESESGERRWAVRPVPKATASRPPVVAVESESEERWWAVRPVPKAIA